MLLESSSFLEAKISENGDLVLEGQDLGRLVQETWGDEDYEYWLTVAGEYKDTVLLYLLKERFESETAFREWLKEREIPHRFMSF